MKAEKMKHNTLNNSLNILQLYIYIRILILI